MDAFLAALAADPFHTMMWAVAIVAFLAFILTPKR